LKPIDILAIAAAAKKEAGRAIKDAFPAIADLVRAEVAAKELKTIGDIAATIKGDKGDKGDPGQDGKDGLSVIGPKGDKGEPGQSIKGDKGDPGANGNDGKAGAKGKDGRDGKDGNDGVGVNAASVDDDGDLVITLTDGNKINAGRVKGRDGRDGVTSFGGGGSRSNVTVGDTPPSNPQVGDIWIDTN